MIKANENNVTCRGLTSTLLAELSMIVKAMKDNDIPEEMINYAVQLGCGKKDE
jgi:hypothetical protein